MKNYGDWARRRAGKGPSGHQQQPQRQTGPQAEGPGALPPPPPGYGWVHNPQYGWMAVPLAGAPVEMRQPAYSPAPQNPPANPAAAYRPSPPTKTCELVKPAHDTYAQLLAGVPDLIPPSGWDAMAGNPDPAVLQELQALPEYRDVGPGANHGTPSSAFPEGRPLVTKVGDLKG